MTEKLTSWFNLPTFEMIFVSDAILFFFVMRLEFVGFNR